MDKYKLKFTRLQNEIIRFLAIKAGDSYSSRSIAKALSVSAMAISKSLSLLEEEKIIIINKDKDVNKLLITFNRERSWDIKRQLNLNLIYESGLAKFLSDKYEGATIILFGSYSRGEDTVDSDVDIAIIGYKEQEIDTSKYDRFLEREIILQFYEDFKIKKHLRDNILNGIVLEGGIDL